MQTDIQYHSIENFRFEDQTVLDQAKVAYIDVNPNATKTALIITCFRGRLQSTLSFANGAPKGYRVILVALFGNGESSSPSNAPGFPKSIGYRDCVRAQHHLLTLCLNVTGLDVVLGFSMGGQCAYYWTLMYPDFVQSAIVICSSARTSRHNYQFLEGPKAALENSVDFVDTNHATNGKPIRGLRAFGKAYSAWLTSAEWFDQEMYQALGYETLDEWDSTVAGKNYDDWDAGDLLAMLRMWQKGDITVLHAPETQSLEEALSHIKARVLLMPCKTDQYFRWEASEKEARSIKSATLKVIPSIWGHLAGAGSNEKDTKWLNEQIAEFLGQS